MLLVIWVYARQQGAPLNVGDVATVAAILLKFCGVNNLRRCRFFLRSIYLGVLEFANNFVTKLPNHFAAIGPANV